MEFPVATVTLTSMAPYSVSRKHSEPRFEQEQHAAYELRTWRSKLHTATRKGVLTVVQPAHGYHQAFAGAAKYTKRKIEGQRNATWTQKFLSGIMLLEDPSLNIDPATVESVTISAHADGRRGSGTRVDRTFPIIPEWSTTFEVIILDPIITRDIFSEMVKVAGLFMGVGRFRPENGGMNGRFQLDKLAWADNRKLVA
jgi:hypothetical protein